MQSEWQTFLSAHEVHKTMPQHCGMIDLSDLGLLKVSGPKAKELLQGQLTCDLNQVTPNQTKLGAHCNPQGRIISLFRLFQQGNNYYLQMPRNLITTALLALKKYAVFFKAELMDASDEFVKILYYGNQLNNFISTLPEKIDDAIQTDNVFIIKLADDQFEIIGDHSAIAELWHKLSTTHPRLTNDYWHYLAIKNGHATIYNESSGKFLPHEINLPQQNGVSFTKGCYTGQEIIARVQYRGKLKTKLQTLEISNPVEPQRGSDIEDTNISGTLVDYCNIGADKYQILLLTSEHR